MLLIGSYRRTPNGIELLFPVKAIGADFIMIPVDSSARNPQRAIISKRLSRDQRQLL
jgi:hypothetical protein